MSLSQFIIFFFFFLFPLLFLNLHAVLLSNIFFSFRICSATGLGNIQATGHASRDGSSPWHIKRTCLSKFHLKLLFYVGWHWQRLLHETCYETPFDILNLFDSDIEIYLNVLEQVKWWIRTSCACISIYEKLRDSYVETYWTSTQNDRLINGHEQLLGMKHSS